MSKLENERTESGEMQQMWRTYDATQSLQSLWILQQERNRYCRKLIKKAIVQELGVLLNSFSF